MSFDHLTKLPAEAAGDPAMYWLIVLLDLGVAVPIAAIAATGLLRHRPWATLLHRGLVGWYRPLFAPPTTTVHVSDDRGWVESPDRVRANTLP